MYVHTCVYMRVYVILVWFQRGSQGSTKVVLKVLNFAILYLSSHRGEKVNLAGDVRLDSLEHNSPYCTFTLFLMW